MIYNFTISIMLAKNLQLNEKEFKYKRKTQLQR